MNRYFVHIFLFFSIVVLTLGCNPTNQSEIKPESSLQKIYNDLEQREYNISFDDESQFLQSPNRQNNIRSYFRPGIWEMQQRLDSTSNWNLKIEHEGIYFDNQKLQNSQFQNQIITNNRVDFQHADFTEQYINSKVGIRQNFIIHNAPAATKVVEVKLKFDGLKSKKYNDGWKFYNNETSLVYSDIKTWDANGDTLSSFIHINPDDKTIQLIALVEDAQFPVTIDPIVAAGNPTNDDGSVEPDQASAQFGFSVSGAGDVNGDGYSDIIVGANAYDNGSSNEGAAFVYHGSSTGLNTTVQAQMEIDQASAFFGESVSNAGDVNNDGYSDVVVGAHFYDNGSSNEGGVWVYHGSASGINTTAVSHMESDQASCYFGQSVSGAGDVNGDGYSDIIVGSPEYDNGQSNEGRTYVYHGSASGINTTAAAILEEDDADDFFGWFVSGAGDINGDGYSDIVVGAATYNNGHSGEGAAYFYHGSASGINTAYNARVEADQTSAQMGYCVSEAGDVNGDGYSDVAVGAYLYDNGQSNEGAVFIYHGTSSGINTTAQAQLESNQVDAYFGRYHSAAGDVNGDGYSDLIVGAYFYDNGGTNEGSAFVYHGSASGLSTSAASVIESNLDNSQLGHSVSGAGDLNGDGFSDILVGCYLYTNGHANEGTVFTFHGSSSGIGSSIDVQLEGNEASGGYGASVAMAGDVNGDGFDDVIVGADWFDNGTADEGAAFVYHGSASGLSTSANKTVDSGVALSLFGNRVAGAGDVNGDGYDDVIVGAQWYTNGQSTEGAAFVYHGASGGISTTAATHLEGGTASYYFGYDVDGAGDINGDGYADIIVGAIGFANGQAGEGAAFIYHGSASGIGATANDTLECNQASAQMGSGVAGAGDVNGDGYADVLVGANMYDNGQTNEGRIYIYHGTTTGINTTAAATLEPDDAGAQMGYNPSSAGDVNGDGYSDIIADAEIYSNGQTDEGAVFIHHGSGAGINTVAAVQLESDQASSQFGILSSGGDFNGDGYSDIAVGAIDYDNGQADEGAVFVYLGSSSGISASADIQLESDEAGAKMGYGVAGNGDVNGDGYCDLVTSAYSFDNGQSNEGAAFVYYGNAGGGLRRNLDLYNNGGTTPIQQSNYPNTSFAVGLFAKSPEGRTKGKLVWETKGHASAFSSGATITNSVTSTSKGSFTNLGIAGTELTSDVSKVNFNTKVRARIEYDPVTSLNGQVYSKWIYPPGYFGSQGMSSTPLPVELIWFEAKPTEQNNIKLEWITASETNNDFFTIEKSQNGRNWIKLSKVDGKGTTNTLSYYESEDIKPFSGKSYYRLKQTDFDGLSEYSETKSVEIPEANKNFKIYPNPTKNFVFLESEIDDIQLSIYYSDGKDVTAATTMHKTRNGQYQINLANCNSGYYFIKTNTGEILRVLKI